MSDDDTTLSYEELKGKVFEVIDSGIAILEGIDSDAISYIRDNYNKPGSNGLIFALGVVFVDSEGLHLLHTAFENVKEVDGKDLTKVNARERAMLLVAYYTRDAVVTDWLGDGSEKNFDNETMLHIKENAFLKQLICGFADQSRTAFQAQTNTENYVALRL